MNASRCRTVFALLLLMASSLAFGWLVCTAATWIGTNWRRETGLVDHQMGAAWRFVFGQPGSLFVVYASVLGLSSMVLLTWQHRSRSGDRVVSIVWACYAILLLNISLLSVVLFAAADFTVLRGPLLNVQLK